MLEHAGFLQAQESNSGRYCLQKVVIFIESQHAPFYLFPGFCCLHHCVLHRILSLLWPFETIMCEVIAFAESAIRVAAVARARRNSWQTNH
jgi:hypothetical protein